MGALSAASCNICRGTGNAGEGWCEHVGGKSKSKLAVHFSSKTDDWSTPQDLFDKLDAEFGGLVLDVCATRDNAKCPLYFSREQDGLTKAWADYTCPVWMNPPYGREIGKWVAKAALEAALGATVVCLLPARTDTRWWHDYVIPYGEIRFIKGRLKFGGAKTSAPFPSAVVIFKPRPEQLR